MDEGVAAVVASAVTGGTAVAVGALTYLATRLQSRTEHMLWRSQSRQDAFAQWLTLAGELSTLAREALESPTHAQASAIAGTGMERCNQLMGLVTAVELHGPAHIAKRFEDWILATAVHLDAIKRLGDSVPEGCREHLDEALEKSEICLRELTAAAREALDHPTRRRAGRIRPASGWLRQ
ncbi:hypothetical protein ABT112_05680 [Streptomyces sp. NPDC002055]|uniref:hypothetical protein n=1 Tax=Streptomyces sp. NPDC002055 TaxID=3154534 RepID=UPI00331F5DC4